MSAWISGNGKAGIRAGKEMLKNKMLFLITMILGMDRGFLLPCCNLWLVLVKVMVWEDPDLHITATGALLGTPHGHPNGL